MFIYSKARIKKKVNKLLQEDAESADQKAFNLFTIWDNEEDPIAKLAFFEYISTSKELKIKYREPQTKLLGLEIILESNTNESKHGGIKYSRDLDVEKIRYSKYTTFMDHLFNDPLETERREKIHEQYVEDIWKAAIKG